MKEPKRKSNPVARLATRRLHCRLDNGYTTPVWILDWGRVKSERCSVYVITPDGGRPSKIGISRAPVKRLAALQGAHWSPMSIERCYHVETSEMAYKVEQEAHKILGEAGLRLLGEWFQCNPQKAGEAIEWAALTLGADLQTDIPKEYEAAADLAYYRAFPYEVRNEIEAERSVQNSKFIWSYDDDVGARKPIHSFTVERKKCA